MAKPVCMVPGKELSDAAEDFRSAKRIEQYRVSCAGNIFLSPRSTKRKNRSVSSVQGTVSPYGRSARSLTLPSVPKRSICSWRNPPACRRFWMH